MAELVEVAMLGDFYIGDPLLVCVIRAVILGMAGFMAWILGNVLWIVHGRRSGDHYVIVMFGFYLVTAIVGLYNLARRGI